MIHFFAKHPTAANLIMILFLALGITTLTRLERETFPDFTDLEVIITVLYPGATAAEIEDAVCRRIEEVVEGVAFVDEVIAESQDNLATVTVSMEEGQNFQKFMSDVKTEVESIDDFPDLVETPIIRSRGDKQQVVSIAVGGDMDVAALKAYSENLKDRLLGRDEISLVTLEGFSQRQLRIAVAAKELQQLGLSPASLARIVSNQSLDLPSGELETNEANVVVRLTEERRSAEDLKDLVIAGGESGAEVRLGDVAHITDVFEDEEEKFMINGRRAALLQVQKTSAEDALTVYAAVEDFVESERKRMPDVALFLTRDFTSITNDRLQMLTKNAWQGLLLVFFTLWLFFNFRLSFWVTMGLPVSFLGAFFFMPLLGVSINMITMVGLLLALGLLMDDAIVIAENVATHLKRGEDALTSVVNGVSEVKWGVFSSFLTTVCVFGPITTLSGNIGQILRVMPVVLILVLSVSLIEAFLILPNHLSHGRTKREQKEARFRAWFDQKLFAFREKVLGRTVDWAVKHRYFTVGGTVAFFLISLSLMAGGILKFQAFPSIDGDVIEARLQMQQGTPLARTEAMAARLELAMHEVAAELQPRQTKGQELVQNLTIQFNTNGASGARGPHLAKVGVDLLGAEQRVGTVNEILNLWRAKVGHPTDVVSLVFTEPSVGPAGFPIEIRFFGQDLDRLKTAAMELQVWLDTFQGVRDLEDDLHPAKPEQQVTMREGALALGLTAADLAEQLRGAYQGVPAREIQVGDDNYEIQVMFPIGDRDALPDLEYFHVALPNGSLAPLETVARVENAARGYGNVVRVDGRRAVTVRADVDTDVANVNELIAAFQTEFLPLLSEKFPELDYAIEGETAEAGKTSASLLRGFQLGLLGVFLLLSFQFRSYREPLIVMAAIPLCLTGVIWGHLLLGYPLTMPSMMGFVSLMGVVVNDAILLSIFIDNRIDEGATPYEAVTGASRDRFRAILLTTLTTVAGLFPLLTEQSMQAQILIPLAISLIFGLLASTFLVLIVIPCLYLMTGIAEARMRKARETPILATPITADGLG